MPPMQGGWGLPPDNGIPLPEAQEDTMAGYVALGGGKRQLGADMGKLRGSAAGSRPNLCGAVSGLGAPALQLSLQNK